MDASRDFDDSVDASGRVVSRVGAPASAEAAEASGPLASVVGAPGAVNALVPASDGRTVWGLVVLDGVSFGWSDRGDAPLGVAVARRAMDRRISRVEVDPALVTTTKRGSRSARRTSMPSLARSRGIGLLCNAEPVPPSTDTLTPSGGASLSHTLSVIASSGGSSSVQQLRLAASVFGTERVICSTSAEPNWIRDTDGQMFAPASCGRFAKEPRITCSANAW